MNMNSGTITETPRDPPRRTCIPGRISTELGAPRRIPRAYLAPSGHGRVALRGGDGRRLAALNGNFYAEVIGRARSVFREADFPRCSSGLPAVLQFGFNGRLAQRLEHPVYTRKV